MGVDGGGVEGAEFGGGVGEFDWNYSNPYSILLRRIRYLSLPHLTSFRNSAGAAPLVT